MNEVEAGLYEELAADTAVIDALNDSTAIYNQVAPQGTAKPYIVFGPGVGGKENINPSDLRNFVYPVKAVSDASKEAGTIQGLILSCLHGTTLTVSGFANIYTACETQIQYAEMSREGAPIFHGGWDVRIRLDA